MKFGTFLLFTLLYVGYANSILFRSRDSKALEEVRDYIQIVEETKERIQSDGDNVFLANNADKARQHLDKVILILSGPLTFYEVEEKLSKIIEVANPIRKIVGSLTQKLQNGDVDKARLQKVDTIRNLLIKMQSNLKKDAAHQTEYGRSIINIVHKFQLYGPGVFIDFFANDNFHSMIERQAQVIPSVLTRLVDIPFIRFCAFLWNADISAELIERNYPSEGGKLKKILNQVAIQFYSLFRETKQSVESINLKFVANQTNEVQNAEDVSADVKETITRLSNLLNVTEFSESMKEVVADIKSKDPLEKQLEVHFEATNGALKEIKDLIQVVATKIELEAHDLKRNAANQEANAAEGRLSRIVKRIKNLVQSETTEVAIADDDLYARVFGGIVSDKQKELAPKIEYIRKQLPILMHKYAEDQTFIQELEKKINDLLEPLESFLEESKEHFAAYFTADEA